MSLGMVHNDCSKQSLISSQTSTLTVELRLQICNNEEMNYLWKQKLEEIAENNAEIT